MGEWQRSSTPPPPATAPVVFLQVGLGILLVFLCHLLALAAAVFTFGVSQELPGDGARDLQDVLLMVSASTVLGLSCVQPVYVAPLAAVCWFVRRPIALGVVIGAALTFLLQGACYGMFCLAGVG